MFLGAAIVTLLGMSGCERPVVKHDEWLRKWNESSANRRAKQYKTLRGFVIASYRQQL